MKRARHDSADRCGVTRRGFLQDAAALAGGVVAGPSVWAAEKKSPIRHVGHVVVADDKSACCGHPRQCGIKTFGGGELAVLYLRAACGGNTSSDVFPGPLDGPMSRADVVLRRSLDGGQKWLPENESVVWSNSLSAEKQGEFFSQDPANRPVLDMSRPEAMFFFGRTWIRLARSVKNTKLGWTCEVTASGLGTKASNAFQIRSIDKGRTWERVPLVLFDRPPGTSSLAKDNHPLVAMPDGALVGAMESERAVWLYGSECQGMTWQYLSLIAMEKAGVGRPCRAGLILLPSGRLQCYLCMLHEASASLCLSESDDGFSWREPRAIAGGVHDPWPLRLRDGRILVVFARRQRPSGIGAIVSEDDGRTWSAASAIRGDAGGPDIGGAVAAELGGGRVFAAYQYQLPHGNRPSRPPVIGGSLFELS